MNMHSTITIVITICMSMITIIMNTPTTIMIELTMIKA